MKREQQYLTFDGERYSYQPMTRRPRRSVGEFLLSWCRWAVGLFLLCAVVYTLYYLEPFPALQLFGVILHP